MNGAKKEWMNEQKTTMFSYFDDVFFHPFFGFPFVCMLHATVVAKYGFFISEQRNRNTWLPFIQYGITHHADGFSSQKRSNVRDADDDDDDDNNDRARERQKVQRKNRNDNNKKWNW